ncbi:hypothetical protein LTR78_001575 [Recurvomyces mirabilis]|uniref:N-acetyltransferase domain-containing protein n=1 Tax=Recurvomyces mirabilis TaxID=574656 RepID=A0AAE0WVA8_9PEZI|nr:hypothetical protein LTR78_001575 [Recurvomyces mirabilis]KAK5151852.1 hypothetical protein LTS14_008986 [Recurvomyces mirabilis]
MPRDLSALAKEDTLQGMSQLTKSPDAVEELQQPRMTAEEENEMLQGLTPDPPRSKRDELHPYTQNLSLSDVESCTRLEEEAFPPQERCSREKFQYRLSHCGELSLGIFTSHEGNDIATAQTSAPVYSGAPHRKAVLLGHVIATKTTNPTVTDNDMAIPSPTSQSSTSDADPGSLPGHKEIGRTLCIHSLAVLPGYQGRGLGRTLMKAYLQRIESHGVADRVALIAHEHLIKFYEGFGFVNQGGSKCQFGGGGWFDMVRELDPEGSGMPSLDGEEDDYV